MTRPKRYPQLTKAQQRQFRRTAKRLNLDVTRQCPLCLGRRLRREERFRFCESHVSWLCRFAIDIACHDCKVEYGVLHSDRCRADEEALAS